MDALVSHTILIFLGWERGTKVVRHLMPHGHPEKQATWLSIKGHVRRSMERRPFIAFLSITRTECNRGTGIGGLHGDSILWMEVEEEDRRKRSGIARL